MDLIAAILGYWLIYIGFVIAYIAGFITCAIFGRPAILNEPAMPADKGGNTDDHL